MTAVEELSIAAAIRRLGLFDGTGPAISDAPTMASPSWWGADSVTASVAGPVADPRVGTSAFVKVLLPHALARTDVGQALAAATEAGKCGIGPAVLLADPASGTLVTDDWTGRARTATQDDFLDATAFAELCTRRAAVAALTSVTRTATVFDDVRRLHELALTAGATLPPDLPWMLRLLAPAEARIRATGWDAVPVHGDATISNVLLTDAGQVLLVDWDHVSRADPLQDLGAVLNELRPVESEAMAAFEQVVGTFDAARFDRCRVYGIADCVRGGLIGAHADAVRPGTLEYSKFSDWQFLWARRQLGDARFDDRVRNL